MRQVFRFWDNNDRITGHIGLNFILSLEVQKREVNWHFIHNRIVPEERWEVVNDTEVHSNGVVLKLSFYEPILPNLPVFSCVIWHLPLQHPKASVSLNVKLDPRCKVTTELHWNSYFRLYRLEINGVDILPWSLTSSVEDTPDGRDVCLSIPRVPQYWHGSLEGWT